MTAQGGDFHPPHGFNPNTADKETPVDPLSAALIAANLVLIGAGIGKGSKGGDDADEEEEADDGDDNAVSMAT